MQTDPPPRREGEIATAQTGNLSYQSSREATGSLENDKGRTGARDRRGRCAKSEAKADFFIVVGGTGIEPVPPAV